MALLYRIPYRIPIHVMSSRLSSLICLIAGGLLSSCSFFKKDDDIRNVGGDYQQPPAVAQNNAASSQQAPGGFSGDGNGIAAVVNGKVITKSEVREAVEAQTQMLRIQFREEPDKLQKELADLKGKALDNLIDRELILGEFKKLGGVIKPQYVDDDINQIVREGFKGNRDAFVTELAKSGMTMKKFRELREKMIMTQVMRSRHAGEMPPPTPREVEAFYAKNAEKYRENDMIKINTITIPKFTGEPGSTPEAQKKIAQEVRSKILAGGDFATLAKSYSKDSRADVGGEYDWMERKAMDKSLANVAFALKPGGVSSVVEEAAAFIIIYCDAKKLGPTVPLDKVRPEIEKAINAEKSKDSLDTWLANLRKKSVIKRYGW
jgi:peptidyl-prolyl cis-trans isomerase SurA